MADPITLDPLRLDRYRAQTFRLITPVRTVDDARRFVAARGFVYFWPIKGITLPSLWVAVAGDRPVASAHNDPGHVSWGWKDESLDKRWWYYAKVLRGKATLISLDMAPTFYALTENFGDPEEDYLQMYADGILSQPGKLIYETLLREGPLDTVALRRALRMTGKSTNTPFDRGLTELQRDFKILPVGVAKAGAWRYSFIYDLTHRFHPNLPAQARAIAPATAREQLIQRYLDAVGAATTSEIQKLFHWKPAHIATAIEALAARTEILQGVTLPTSTEPYVAAPALLSPP